MQKINVKRVVEGICSGNTHLLETPEIQEIIKHFDGVINHKKIAEVIKHDVKFKTKEEIRELVKKYKLNRNSPVINDIWPPHLGYFIRNQLIWNRENPFPKIQNLSEAKFKDLDGVDFRSFRVRNFGEGKLKNLANWLDEIGVNYVKNI